MALKRLNAEHLLAIQYLSLPRKGGKTDEEIAQICGVSRQSIYNWRNDSLFSSELDRQIRRNIGGCPPNTNGGDTNGIKET